MSLSQFELPVVYANTLPLAAPTIAAHVRTRLVRLPAWFTLAQARRVAELRGVDHVLVELQGRVRGAISCETLARETATDPLARHLVRCEVFASPDMTVDAAVALMQKAGVTCLPVARGTMLVGTISATDLRHPAAFAAAAA